MLFRSEPPVSSRLGLVPERFDLSRPANQRKLEAVEALARVADDAGAPLIQLALAFVINHPAVTSAIIGPRTMEQLESQLGATDLILDDETLDRIDAVVPPGTNVDIDETGWDNPALTPAAVRR